MNGYKYENWNRNVWCSFKDCWNFISYGCCYVWFMDWYKSFKRWILRLWCSLCCREFGWVDYRFILVGLVW